MCVPLLLIYLPFSPSVAAAIVDLTIDSLSVDDSTVDPNQSIQVSWHVTKTGTGQANNFRVRILWSSDSSIDTSDTRLYESSSISLGSTASGIGETDPITIPSDALLGNTYYIGCWVDYWNVVEETNDNNNISSVTVTVNDEPENIEPTISITAGPSGTTHDNDVTFQWLGDDPDGDVTGYEYELDGEGYSSAFDTSHTFYDVSEGPHTFRVRCFDDDGADSGWAIRTFTYEPENIVYTVQLESREDNNASTGRGQIGWDNQSVAPPVVVEAGDYPVDYIPEGSDTFVSWDTTGSVTVACDFCQSTTATVWGNGTLRAVYAAVPLPDLRVSGGLSASPMSVNAGIDTVLNFAIENVGNETITSTIYLGIYLSEDSIITTDDTYVDGFPIDLDIDPDDGIGIGDWSVTIPPECTTGDYYIGVILDPSDNIEEINENNNTDYAYPFEVLTPLPDLRVYIGLNASPMSVWPSMETVLDFSFENAGSETITSTIYMRAYLSEDSTITTGDTYLGEHDIDIEMSPDYGITVTSWPVAIPLEIATGDYYIGIILDPSDNIEEINETNNTDYVYPFHVGSGPDLTVALAANKTEAAVGETIIFENQTTGGWHPYTRAEWDFDADGVPEIVHLGSESEVMMPATYAYDSEGTYTVRLTMTDSLPISTVEERINYITVTGTELNPHLVASKTEVAMGEAIIFDNLTTGGTRPYTKAEWDFDADGIPEFIFTGTEPEVMSSVEWHYWAEGTYTVRLTMTDDLPTSRFEERIDYITVTGTELNPHLIADKTQVEVGEAIIFDNLTTGGTRPYTKAEWDFDADGVPEYIFTGTESEVMSSVEWTYWTEGTYTVRLTMTDSSPASVFEDRINYIVCRDEPYVTVVLPNGGENWALGSTNTITWDSNVGGNISIYIYKNNRIYDTIASSIANDGSYGWEIPTSYDASNSYKVKVDHESYEASDDSNSYFTLQQELSMKILDVPYYDQGMTMWCALNSSSMLLSYYGVDKDPWQIAAEDGFDLSITEGIGNRWPHDWDLKPLGDVILSYLPNSQVELKTFGAQIPHQTDISALKDYLIAEITSERPVLLASVCQKHAVVIVGFDNDNVYINDPSGIIAPDLVRAEVSWDDFEELMLSYLWGNQVQTLSIHSASSPQNKGWTISLRGFADIDDFDEGHRQCLSSIVFQNRIDDVKHMLQLRLDGTVSSNLGYLYIPTRDDGLCFERGTNEEYHTFDSELGYAASLADHLYIYYDVSRVGNSNDATIRLTIHEIDDQGNITNYSPVFSELEEIHFEDGENSRLINSSRFGGHYGGADQDNRLSEILDRNGDGVTDNPHRRYQITATTSDNNGENDRVEIQFAITDAQYSLLHLVGLPESEECPIGTVEYIPFTLMNHGMFSDTPKLIISQIKNQCPSIALSIYHDLNADGFPDGDTLASSDGVLAVDLPLISSNSAAHFVLELTAPSDTNPSDVSGLEFSLLSMADAEDEVSDFVSLSFVESFGMTITAFCPVDISVTDPDGLTITKNINEISGATYVEIDIDGDGDLDDQVIITEKKEGEYIINIIPVLGANPGDTFTLEVIDGGQVILLAEELPTRDIPLQGYVVSVSKDNETDDTPVNIALDSIIENLLTIYAYRAGEGVDGWTSYNPDWPAELNTLTTLCVARGYWICVSEACLLHYGSQSYDLDSGWNLIGWLPQDPVGPYTEVDLITGLESIHEELQTAYGYESGEGADGWTSYNPDWPAELNTLTTLYVARGYWIYVNEACTLQFVGNTYELEAGWNLIGWMP
ncbi:CARDB domain-containing protein [Chloroflexota bacterium]